MIAVVFDRRTPCLPIRVELVAKAFEAPVNRPRDDLVKVCPLTVFRVRLLAIEPRLVRLLPTGLRLNVRGEIAEPRREEVLVRPVLMAGRPDDLDELVLREIRGAELRNLDAILRREIRVDEEPCERNERPIRLDERFIRADEREDPVRMRAELRKLRADLARLKLLDGVDRRPMDLPDERPLEWRAAKSSVVATKKKTVTSKQSTRQLRKWDNMILPSLRHPYFRTCEATRQIVASS